MRKVIIILAALGITGLAYWGYVQLSGSPTIEPPASQSEHDMQLPESADQTDATGQTTMIHGADDSYYITRDPATLQVKRVFGFSRLINPGASSARWEVEKPYIIFYESTYQCRIDADKGLFQVERAGSSVSPKDGQLDGNVVIQLKPRPGSQMAETVFLLDDLLYSSERTEFSTDGPLRVISSQVDLSGRGLVLLVNAQDGQVEYMHILDLISLRLKDFVPSKSPVAIADAAPAVPVETQSPAPEQVSAPTAAVAAKPDAVVMTPAAEAAGQGDAIAEQTRLYQCVIENNVQIRYGDQIVVAGAEQVNIQNILLKAQPSENQQTPASTEQAAAQPSVPPAAPAQTTPQEIPSVTPFEDVQVADADRDDSRDVVVTCDGGILLQPMPGKKTQTPAQAVAIEMNGTPLRIEQVSPESPSGTQPLVYCGLLQYDLGAEVLRLYTDNRQDEILLGGGTTAAGRIETRGPVMWNRKANQAQIGGPGVVYLDGAPSDSADKGRIDFAGQMELVFADAPAQNSSLKLSSVNLTGGMSANLDGRGGLKTAAESAYLAFGPENAIASARLQGAVRFENTDASSPSTATASTAVFHFNDNSQLARADLTGDVQFASQSGRLQTEEAVIAFGADPNGQIQPMRFETTAQATLQTAEQTTSKQPPARFEARTINYDLLSGSGRAVGPVRFVFYQPADPNDPASTVYWPVEINADGDAEFLAGSDRQIETVIFKDNVRGLRTQTLATYIQEDAFHCETMVVTIGPDDLGKTDIRQITLRDGDVYAESKRTHETLKLAHLRLSGQQIVYDRIGERFRATGPGLIEMDNSKAEPTASSGGALDMSGPSFARIEGFEQIEWTTADRRIVADGGDDVLQVAYIPLENGVASKLIRAAAGQVEMTFTDSPDGQSQLERLTARRRVFFEERNAHILEGYAMEYDAARDGWLSITGTDDRPCMADGARVPYIHYNLNTGQLETRLSTIPGAVTTP